MSRAAMIIDAVRTPIGRLGGALAEVRPDDLAATVLRRLVERQVWLDPGRVDEIYMGSANGAGEDNRNVARMAGLLAGFPTSVPGATVNRLCGSGLEAVIQACRTIETGDASIAVAGGVESMSRAPWVVPKPSRGYAPGHGELWSTTLGWRMTNPAMPTDWTIPLGEGAELLAGRYQISREAQDRFAAESHCRAADAWARGHFAAEVEQVSSAALELDESIRPETDVTTLAILRPAFRGDGTVTAGNSSPLNDGAAAVLLVDSGVAESEHLTPIARVAGRAVSGVDPDLFGIGPVAAANEALRRAGIDWGDLDRVELNEAFAAQALACLKAWPELDPGIVNLSGGAIAIGHPLGCSGSRIVTTLAHGLRRTGGHWGLATLCIGVGQGLAVVLERQ